MVQTTSGSNQKKWVWVPCQKELYKPAYVLEEDNTRVRVQSDTIEEHSSADVFRMNPPKFDLAENLSSLSHLNEPSVLHNIQMRYNDSLMYTYSGLFLLALNPYRKMNIYSNEIKQDIMREKRGESAPHIFSVASEAYRAMVANRENQSILITGESGAGKTENTKKVIEFLAFAASVDREDAAVSSIEGALVSANPLLEAFGNAKTVKNDNSSRFGKFIQVKFREGKICGAKIEKYLLEKSRVMSAPSEERSFHIFYYLLAGASSDLLARLSLRPDPSAYECLRSTQYRIPGVDDRREFENLGRAFEELGVADPTPYYRTVAAILHLSNVKIVETNDRAVIGLSDEDYRPLELASELLNVPCNDFMNAIVNPVLKAGNELVVHYRTKEQALAILEGFAKMLYESLFDALIAEINRRLDTTCDNYIGILDIAGFEIFKTNSFEQLCINYTNEKLQQYFNHHMFILEQEVYRSEEIDWSFIDFGLDLEPTIRTIEASNPIGVLSYLDEECVMPCANDRTLLEKLRRVRGVESLAFRDSFTINHYAGKVEYEVKNWLRKNKDVESEALLLLVSENKKGAERESRQFIKKGTFKTVAQSHKEGLKWLMDTLRNTQPHFVRCILPNLTKSPESFAKKLILDQLRCNGVLEGIRISRLGYPTRLAFGEFNDRYGFFNERGGDEADTMLPKERSIALLDLLMLNKNSHRVGRTMVFFRQGVIADLEELREKKIVGLAEVVQAMVRARIAAKKESLDRDRTDAIHKLQRNANLSLKLLRWNWWYLFLKVQPLLDVKRAENDRKQLQEQMEQHQAVIQKTAQELAERARENMHLQMLIDELRTEIAKKEGELADREGLLESLRVENAHIPSYVSALHDREESIAALKASLGELTVRGEASEEARGVLERQHEELGRAFDKKVAELDLMIKQDLGNILQGKEDELREVRGRLGDAEKDCAEAAAENSRLAAALGQKREELAVLTGRSNQCESEMCALRTELDRTAAEQSHAVATSNDIISKLKQEIADLQLENDSLGSKCIQMEGTIQSDENVIKSLTQDLNYQKVRNSGLEASVQALKNLKVVEREEVVKKADDEDAAALNKTISSLRAKLANEQKMSARLAEEKDALYDENVKLMQSKLDDLFSTESEFTAAKSAMQSEIRRLEADNAALRSELLAAQNVSDYSDDSGLERMTLLLEEERRQRKSTDMRIVELENGNLKLENQLSCLRNELAESERRSAEIRRTSVARAELGNIKKELAHAKKYLTSISAAFQANFFDILAKKDQYYTGLVSRQNKEIAELNTKISQLEEVRHCYGNLGAVYDELKRRFASTTTELEALTVDNKALQATVQEHRQHISKLEEAYNEREVVVSGMKSKYSEALEELNSRRLFYLDSIKQIKEQMASKYNKEFSDALQMVRKASGERIAELTGENEALRSRSGDMAAQLHKAQVENNELSKLVESLSQSNEIIDKKMEDLGPLFCAERLVSTFVVDKDAFKASEWKNLVAGKCQRCAEVKFEPAVSSNGAEVMKLGNEIRELKLKLAQSERVAEENQKIIETMRACMASVRKAKGVENK